MTTKKKLLDDALGRFWTIESYQNEIISCLENSGVALGGLKNALEDFPRDFEEGMEKLNALLEAADFLEGWATAHRQDIQELGEVMAEIEKTQNRKPGGRKCY